MNLNTTPKEPSNTSSVLPPDVYSAQNSTTPINAPSIQPAQNTPSTPQYVKVMPTICLILGVITAIGSLIAVFGIISGLFLSSQGFAIASGLLFGTLYAYIRLYGSIICIATAIAVFTAKGKYHISIKKPIIMTICSIIMIHLPMIIIFVTQLVA